MPAISLFSVPIYRASCPGPWHHALFTETTERMPDDSGWISHNRQILDEPVYQDLAQLIRQHCQDFIVGDLKIDPQISWQITNSWLIRHEHSDFSPMHYHANSVFSGVYFARCNDLSGDFELICEHDTVTTKSWQFPTTGGSCWSDLSYKFTPQQGDLIVFPSHLTHRVSRSRSNETRLTVAFNLFPRARLDSAGYVLDTRQ